MKKRIIKESVLKFEFNLGEKVAENRLDPEGKVITEIYQIEERAHHYSERGGEVNLYNTYNLKPILNALNYKTRTETALSDNGPDTCRDVFAGRSTNEAILNVMKKYQSMDADVLLPF